MNDNTILKICKVQKGIEKFAYIVYNNVTTLLPPKVMDIKKVRGGIKERMRLMKKVACLSLNPAFDKMFYVDDFTLDDVNRVSSSYICAGSKGVNVARIMAKCGFDALCYGFAGGRDSDLLCEELERYNVSCDFIKVDYNIRTNIKIIDLKNKTYTDVNTNGGIPEPEQLDMLRKKTRSLAKDCDVVTLCGTVSKGFPEDIYKELCQIIKSEGAKAVVDCSGVPLSLALESAPDFIKPNLKELQETLGITCNFDDEIALAAKQLYDRGINNVVVSMGSRGAIAYCDGRCFKIRNCDLPVYNTVGAGDAFVSGFIYGKLNDLDISDTLRYAASFSQALVTSRAAADVTIDEFKYYFDKVKVEDYECD